jgi:hypothetical protein
LLPDRITAHFFFLLAGFFGREITEGRSIYRRESFGTTARMFRLCFLISGPAASDGCADSRAFLGEKRAEMPCRNGD